MRITLVVSSLSSGGAERVVSIMANYWAAKGTEVTLITLTPESLDFYALHPKVRRIGLGLIAESSHPWEALSNNLRRLRTLRREIRASEPDAAISFVTNMNILTLLSSFDASTPIVVSERVDAKEHVISLARACLRRILYPRAKAIVVQSFAMGSWAEKYIPKRNIHVVPNPVSPPSTTCGGADFRSLPHCSVIAMGRLVPQKGFDLLVRAFACCAPEHSDWKLTILGEGAERRSLEMLAKELGIVDRVSLPGQVKEPAKYLVSADLFVLSSRYEGFPNALLEAMSCGLPVVSFDCPSGPREIVRDGVDGVLVENGNVETLTVAIDRLMSDESERERMGTRAAEVTERFGLEKVMKIWGDVLNQVVERGRA